MGDRMPESTPRRARSRCTRDRPYASSEHDGLGREHREVGLLDAEVYVQPHGVRVPLLDRDQRVRRRALRPDAAEVEDLLEEPRAHQGRGVGSERGVRLRGGGGAADAGDVEERGRDERPGRVVGGHAVELPGDRDRGQPLSARDGGLRRARGHTGHAGVDERLVLVRVRERLGDAHRPRCGGGDRCLRARRTAGQRDGEAGGEQREPGGQSAAAHEQRQTVAVVLDAEKRR
jgi:hypothetical protein